MASQNGMPDLLIAIDFGMTYTGVAWTNFSTPGSQVINDWLGTVDDDGKKVPTRMAISQYNTIVSWGYQLNHVRIAPPDRVMEGWKIFLDQEMINTARQANLEDVPRSVGEAQAMVTIYLREIYDHIKESIQGVIGRGWSEKKILFVFSLPTTWTSQATVETFKEAIASAGFGTESPLNHTAEVELTEAEAAAVFTLKESPIPFNVGDVLMVCDAGGGTTDLGLFQVRQTTNPLSLVQIHQVQGVGIGATMIDRAFMNLVKSRLQKAPDAALQLPRDLPKRLASGLAFRTVKHSFGGRLGNHLKYYIPTAAQEDIIPSSFSDPRLGIESGRMIFSRSEIQALFDRQIVGITKKIDGQLKWMMDARSSEQVKYLVLSGGLGSSAYLRSQLEETYRRGAYTNAHNMSILRSNFPQLAVVKGLIDDKRQKLECGMSLLTFRLARRSYGIICMEEWDPRVHFAEDVREDLVVSGRRWAINQIDWIIKKGDIVNVDTTRDRPFSRNLLPGDPTRQWETSIVVSDYEAAQLPRSMKQAGAQKLCTIQSSLSRVPQIEFEEHSKRCWQKGKHHFTARFTIKVMISAADLRFELWFKDRKYSNPHEPVGVQWDAAGVTSKPPEEVEGSGLGMMGSRRWGEM